MPETKAALGDIASQMDAASICYAKKDWSESIRLYQSVIDEYGGAAPAVAFVRLAVSLRREKRYEDCEAVLEAGLGYYRGHRPLMAEHAALEMQRRNWSQAADWWLSYYQEGKCTAANYNRYAHTLEQLGRWDEHETLILRGMARFPHDVDLVARLIFNAAQSDERAKSWASAARKYTFLGKRMPSSWPFARRYREQEAKIQAELARLPSRIEQLEHVRSSQLNVAGHIWPEVAAGTLAALDLDTASPPVDSKLRAAIAALVGFFRWTDLDVKSIRGVSEYDELVAELNRCVSPETLVHLRAPASTYKFLCRVLMCHGYVKGYWLLREKYVGSLLERKNTIYSKVSPHDGLTSATNPPAHEWSKADLIDFTDQIGLANELGDREYFEFLNAVHAPGGSENMVVQAVSRLYHYEAPLYRDINPAPKEPVFARLLEGKSVAVVGPIDVGLESGAEIESYDIVVRFNHRKVLRNDPSHFGTRTNVSYYISSDLPKVKNQTFIDVMNALDFTVIDEGSMKKAPWLSEVRSPIRPRLRAFQHTINPFLFGCPNGIQRVIMDMLRFNVKKIKVFNSNLFLDANYSGGYRKKVFDPFPGFSLHDPVSNLIFLQRAYANGHFEADECLAEVLKLTPRAYVEALDEIYRPLETLGRA